MTEFRRLRTQAERDTDLIRFVRAPDCGCTQPCGHGTYQPATEAERDPDGTTSRPGGAVNGNPVPVQLDPDECVLVVREGVGVMCVRDHHQHDPAAARSELELHNSRHAARIWETVSGWVWSCKQCEARGVRLPSQTEAMAEAMRHMRSEVPWWRKMLGR